MPVDPYLIKWSFSVVERRAEQLPKFFYAHLFHHHPEVRAMFPARMDEQRDRLFAALTTAAKNIDQTDTLVAYLRGLGFDHRKFGTRPEHYPAVGASLIATLKYFAGSAWTPEVEESWVAAYGIITDVMVAAAEDVPEGTPLWWDGEVVDLRRHGDDLVVLTVLPHQHYPYRAGQYTTLCVPQVPQVWRPYSLANAPRRDGSLEFHVRRVPGGLLSTALVEQLYPNNPIRIGPPRGEMTLPPDDRIDMLCVAGGTGWAPIKALLEDALTRRTLQSARVLIGASSDQRVYDVAGHDRLRETGIRVDVVITPDRPRSRPPRAAGAFDAFGSARARREGLAGGSASGNGSGNAGAGTGGNGGGSGAGAELLRELVVIGEQLGRRPEPHQWPHTFVSGPPDMVETVRAQLKAIRGVDPKRVQSDPAAALSSGDRPRSPAEYFLMDQNVPWIHPR